MTSTGLVWFLQAHDDKGRLVNEGSAVAVRVRASANGDERVCLLTCQHVLRLEDTERRAGYGRTLSRVVVWQPDSAFDQRHLTDDQIKQRVGVFVARISPLKPLLPDEVPEERRNAGDDWALLEVDDSEFQDCRAVASVGSPGDSAVAAVIGYAGGSRGWRDGARVAPSPVANFTLGPSENDSLLRLTASDGSTQHGMSGGGVFDAEAGKLLGLHRWRGNLRYDAISIETIVAYLRRQGREIVEEGSSAAVSGELETRVVPVLAQVLGEAPDRGLQFLLDRLVRLSEVERRSVASELLHADLTPERLPAILADEVDRTQRQRSALVDGAAQSVERLLSARGRIEIAQERIHRLPPPIRDPAQRVIETYHRVIDATDGREDLLRSFVGRLRLLMRSWHPFATATSLALSWSRIPQLGSTRAARLRTEFARLDSVGPGSSVARIGSLAYIRRLTVDPRTPVDRRRAESEEFLHRRGLDRLALARNHVIHGAGDGGTDAECWSAILDEDLLDRAIEFIQDTHDAWSDFEIVVPTEVETDANGAVRIARVLREPPEPGPWRSESVSLALAAGDGDTHAVDPWRDSVFASVTPMVVRRDLVEGNGSLALAPTEALSLFPFGFVDMPDERGQPGFYFFGNVDLREGAVERIDYAALDGVSPVRTLGRQQGFAQHTAFSRYLAALSNPAKADDGGNVDPKPVGREHEYVLSGRVTGRDDELQKMTDWLSDPELPNLFCWEARGGDGKSALVNDWLFVRESTRELLREQEYDGALWASFYQPNFTLVELAELVLREMGAAPVAGRNTERILDQFVREAQKKRFLIVLDGFERLLVSDSLTESQAHELISNHGGLPPEHRMCRRLEAGREQKTASPGDELLHRLGQLPARSSRFLFTSRFRPTTVDRLAASKKAIVEELGPLTDEAARMVWWQASGRSAYDDEESASVAQAVEKLGRHPLAIGIVAATVGGVPFGEWRADLLRRHKLTHTPFDGGFETASGESDAPARCGEAIWYCGVTLSDDQRKLLRALQRRAGNCTLEDLRDDRELRQVFSRRGGFAALEKAREQLAERRWLGVSQNDLIEVHPMVRQFARDVRENRGLTKQHRLKPEEYRRTVEQIAHCVDPDEPSDYDPDGAWERIVRLELWESAQRLTPAGGANGLRMFLALLARFLPEEHDANRGRLYLPRLKNRRAQLELLFQIGQAESTKGEYKAARNTLVWAQRLAEWLDEHDWVRRCESSLQWAAMYHGDLKTAETLNERLQYSPQYEIVLALRGAASEVFLAEKPGQAAFDHWDRRWVFQTCAEILLWRGDLDAGRTWLQLMDEGAKAERDAEVGESVLTSTGVCRGQVMWEQWTRGVYKVEVIISDGDYGQARRWEEAIEFLDSARREAQESSYPIVESLAVAFRVRLLANLARSLEDDGLATRAKDEIDAFLASERLGFPIAIAIVAVEQARLAVLSRGPRAGRRYVARAWEAAAPRDNHPFFFGLLLLQRFLEAEPDVSFEHREKVDARIREIKAADPVPVSNAGNETVRRILVFPFDDEGESVPEHDDEWAKLADRYEKEILEYRPLLDRMRAHPRLFMSGLETYARLNHGAVDPLGGVIEMLVDQLEPPGARRLDTLPDLTKHAADLVDGLDDWRSREPSGWLIDRKQVELDEVDREYSDRLREVLLDDAIRILGVDEIDSPSFREWKRLVIDSPRGQDRVADQRGLMSLLEVLVLRRVGIERFVGALRLPGSACYRACYARICTDEALASLRESLPGDVRDSIDRATLLYRLGWGRTRESVRSWWRERSSRKRGLPNILKQLAEQGFSLEQLFDSTEETGSENLQGNIYYLMYARRTKRSEQPDETEEFPSRRDGVHEGDRANRASEDPPLWDAIS